MCTMYCVCSPSECGRVEARQAERGRKNLHPSVKDTLEEEEGGAGEGDGEGGGGG